MQGLAQPRGADRKGRIYLQASPFGGPGGDDAAPTIPDSAPVVRWDRAADRLDTLTRVKIPATRVQRSGGQTARVVLVRPQPYAPQDEWAVAADGRVAVARVSDYHVEWLGDRPSRGAPVGYERVRVGDGDREAFMAAMRNTRNRIVVSSGGPGRGPDMKPPEARAEDFDWPEYKPPFVARSALITPDGQLWVRRHTQARDSVPAYDVFDASGNLSGRVYLPKGRQVVGLGQGTVYAVRTDADGLQWLERYSR
jgi:hypothetical protein